MGPTHYGDISPRTALFAQKDLLERGLPYLCIEKFGQTRELPNRSTKTMSFRRYEALDNTPAALSEGVTPTAQKLTHTDYPVTLKQYGGLVTISDIVQDTHEDPVLQEATELLGEQSAQMIERVRYDIIKAGSNVFYANGSARNAVNTVVTRALQRKVTKSIKRQNGRPLTKVMASTPNWGTEQVRASFIGLVHPDLESDIRDMTDFVPSEKYGTITPWENELGKVEDVRYVQSTIFDSWKSAGGAAGAMESEDGTSADVYPILYIARDAYGIVPLKGQNSLTPMVVNPKPSDSDPLGQRGHVSWKAMQNAVILNDLWMARLEVAATA